MKPVRCPICEGKGRILDGIPTSVLDADQCHGCGGRGWIEVRETDECPVIYARLDPVKEDTEVKQDDERPFEPGEDGD